jgi:hypothetical protein
MVRPSESVRCGWIVILERNVWVAKLRNEENAHQQEHSKLLHRFQRMNLVDLDSLSLQLDQ